MSRFPSISYDSILYLFILNKATYVALDTDRNYAELELKYSDSCLPTTVLQILDYSRQALYYLIWSKAL